MDIYASVGWASVYGFAGNKQGDSMLESVVTFSTFHL
jgi:hypothetical protein